MFKKVLFTFTFLFTLTSDLFAVEAYCYRNSFSQLICEKSLDFIPEEYRTKSFFRDVSADKLNPDRKELNVNSSLPLQNEILPTSNENRPSSFSNSLPPAATTKDTAQPTDQIPSSSSDLDYSKNLPSSFPTENKNRNSKIQIFVAKWCAHCKALEAFLKKEKIDYARFDIEEDEYGKEIYEKEGGGIPITKIGPNTIVGFDEKKFKALIESSEPY